MSEPLPFDRSDTALLGPEAVTTSFTATRRPLEHPVAVDTVGTCPRCGHDTAQTDKLYAISNFSPDGADTYEASARAMLVKGVLAEARFFSQTMQCACDDRNEHPGRRDGEHGCGALWTLDLSW